ncbi:MAG: CHASE domain-containing protein [Planctomycetia bacterium]|nr:CHASE domain-containing protein [Planctomycetia bacterium]
MSDYSPAVKDRLARASRQKWQYVVAAAVLFVGVGLAVGVFFALKGEERENIRNDFDRASQNIFAALRRTVAEDCADLRSVKWFYDGSDEVERHEFARFVLPIIETRKSIPCLQWVPRVAAADRAKHERAAAGEGLANYQIVEYPRGTRTPATARDEYFPVFFVEPAGDNASVLGADLASDSTCREAMDRARDTGEVVATSPIHLPGETGESTAARLFLAVYLRDTPLKTADERRTALQGFVVGVLSADGLIEESMANLVPDGVDVRITDSTDANHPRLLYTHLSRLRAPDNTPLATDGSDWQGDPHMVETLDVAARQWTVAFAAIPEFTAIRATWNPLVAALACLVLTGVLVFYLVGIAARNATALRLAAQLSEVNERLGHEIGDRERAESTLRTSQAKFKAIYDSSSDAIMLWTPAESFVSGNLACVALFACKDEQEFRSQSPAILSPEYQPDGELSATKAQRMMTIALEAGSNFFEWKHKRMDGTEFFATVLLTRVEFEGKRFLQATVRDVTEKKEAEEHQARLLRRVEGINRLQEDLLLPAPIEEKLRRITAAAVELLDLDFCRIWMIRPGDLCERGCMHATAAEECHRCVHREECLHLVASSGRYTHIDGDHRRVPLGAYKIGRIASAQEHKFLTNDATTDPRVHNHAWAKELGLVSFAGYKIRDINGEPLGVFAMFARHPISEEDDAFLSSLAEMTSRFILEDNVAEALRASERRHRLFAENVSDVIWTMDFTGRFTYVSPSVQPMLGYTPEEFGRFTMDQIMTQPSFAEARENLEAFVAQATSGQPATPGSLELELVRKDGTTLWTEVSFSGMYDESGEMLAIQGITHDITERREMEDTLREAKQTMERENAKLSAMISGMEEGIVFADADHVIVEINDYFCRFVGRSREEILGKRIEDIHQGDVLSRILPVIDRFRKQVDSSPFVLQRALGGAEVILRVQPVYRNGAYDGVLLNVIDVSELVKARQAAEAANVAKSQFLASMSHEIRTPMTAILGYAELLMDPALSTSSRNNYATTICRSGEHLLGLINDILDLSKIEAGKMSLDVGRCSLVPLLADVASIVRPRAQEHGVSFLLEYPGEIPETILTDSARLRQAIINLAGNAVKFTQRGSVRVVASFLADWRGDQPAIRIDVIDTGIGIRDEVIPHLFQPFHQGDASTSKKFGGTGLGLAISRHIAHLLGGELTVASVWGEGSTFTLIVPTGSLEGVPVLEHPVEAEGDTGVQVWQTAAEDLKGVRVLLAEDGYDNQRLIKTILVRAGAEVQTADNGRVAVEKAKAEPFDVILMDVNMPEMDG